MGSKWSDEEIELLEELFFKEVPDKTIGDILNRTKNAVKSKRKKEGIVGDPNNRRLTEEARKAMGKKPTGENHWNWQGGKRTNHNGYIEIHKPDHHRARGNGYVFEHIVVAENKIGRKLEEDEVVHHIDGDKKNNKPKNLKVMKINEHSSNHNKGKNKNGKFKVCPVCGNEFYVKKSALKKRVTCSKKCSGVLYKEYYEGKPRDLKISKEMKKDVVESVKQDRINREAHEVA